ncbi:DUF2348 family protein [Medicago truncatula]|uniref:DUF2348 family protein n=1 Tax=Medicago truncatula TaxID=3880 RepID=G7KVU4_MEDTR|nr:DUF2348 family protein [Medicago truncatula]
MEQKELNLLNESLGFNNNNNNLYGQFVLVEDTVDTSAAFVLHHIFKRSFSSHPSSSVIFLALSHPFSHYDRVLRKIVISLSLSLHLHYASLLSLFVSGTLLMERGIDTDTVTNTCDYIESCHLLKLFIGVYVSVCARSGIYGCNLAAQRDNNKFFFIDMLMLQFQGEKISCGWRTLLSIGTRLWQKERFLY